MIAIVGLGNKKVEYLSTRHNIGYFFINILAKRENLQLAKSSQEKSFIGKTVILNTDIILAKPETFMNESGVAVKKILEFNNLAPENLVIVHDDIDISFGKYKLSYGRGSGGNHGVESIIEHLHTKNFWQFKLGIANSNLDKARHVSSIEEKKENVANFVLSNFSMLEKLKLPTLLKSALEYLLENLPKINDAKIS